MTEDKELMARFGLELDGDECLTLTPEARMQLQHREDLLRDRISAEMFRVLADDNFMLSFFEGAGNDSHAYHHGHVVRAAKAAFLIANLAVGPNVRFEDEVEGRVLAFEKYLREKEQSDDSDRD